MQVRGKGEGKWFCFTIKKKQFRRKDPHVSVLVEARINPQRAVHSAEQEQATTFS